MDLSQLKYFLTAAGEENFSNAAKKLYISQPALSRAISRLEEELGVQLFERSSNRVVLNDSGRSFLKYLDKASLELNNGVQAVRRRADVETGYIAMSSSTHGLLAGPAIEFMQAHPQAHMTQYIQSSEQMQASLEARTIDFCISYTDFGDPNISWEPLVRDELLVYLPHGHRLSDRTAVELSELARERMLLYDFGLETADYFISLCIESGFEPDLMFAGNENEVTHVLLSAGLGVFPVPATMHYFRMSDIVPKDTDLGMHAVRLSRPRPERTLGIATLRNRLLSPTVLAFIEFMRGRFARMDAELSRRLDEDFPLSPTFS